MQDHTRRAFLMVDWKKAADYHAKGWEYLILTPTEFENTRTKRALLMLAWVQKASQRCLKWAEGCHGDRIDELSFM